MARTRFVVTLYDMAGSIHAQAHGAGLLSVRALHCVRFEMVRRRALDLLRMGFLTERELRVIGRRIGRECELIDAGRS